MRVLILDLKWSYGIEAITGILHDQLEKRCEVTVVSAAESTLSYSLKMAPSRSYKQMLLASLNPLVYRKIICAIRSFSPDILYIISPHILNSAIAGYCRIFTSIFVISHIHDPGHYGKSLISQLVNLLSFVQSRLSHRIYCWGGTIRETICRRFHIDTARVAVFRHGPGQATFYDSHPRGQRRGPRHHFCMVGALQKRKGIQYFLEAAVLFNRQYGSQQVAFLLAGAGCLDDYRRLIGQLPNLILKNRFVDDAELNEMLGQSYALVLPYVGGVLQSSFVAIAYGNGCPVIVSDIGSLPEEVEEGVTGYVVHKANAAQIAAAMSEIYRNWAWSNLAENCVTAYREKFVWEEIGLQIFRDMENACKCSPKEHKSQRTRETASASDDRLADVTRCGEQNVQ